MKTEIINKYNRLLKMVKRWSLIKERTDEETLKEIQQNKLKPYSNRMLIRNTQ